MAKAAITEQYLTDIADAIRTKTGLKNITYYPSEMAAAILTISGSGGITPAGTISITENGNYNVTQYANASVNVPTGVSPSDFIEYNIYQDENGFIRWSDITPISDNILKVFTKI